MSNEHVRLVSCWISSAAEQSGGDLEDFLVRRRNELQAQVDHPGHRVAGGAIGVPVLAVLAPVVTDTTGVIEYPGDPMCLYAALRDNIAASVTALHSHWIERDPLRDLVLDWAALPDSEYRAAATEHGIRTPVGRRPQVADELVFDPRVWNDDSQRAFRTILTSHRPRFLLISSVSAAHRYAVEIAQTARELLPEVYIVFGGRHADETMFWSQREHRLVLDYSSTVSVMTSGRRAVPVNAVVSGDGGPLLDMLSVAALLVLSAEPHAMPGAAEIAQRLQDLCRSGWRLSGQGVIALVEDSQRIIAFPCAGSRNSEHSETTLYDPFAIRSRFTVFQTPEGEPRRTTHFLTAPSCPFRCTFCSESSAITGASSRLAHGGSHLVVDKLARLVSYGAEAVFFDDPVLWSGQWNAIEAFADAIIETRGLSDDQLGQRYESLADADSKQRWRQLQWGGQLTVDVLLHHRNETRVAQILDKLSRAGCAYIYVGIESMSDAVMSRVHKNLLTRDNRPWPVKVREALTLLKNARLPVGTSVLFGLDGETPDTVDETIEGIGQLIDESLIVLASPNILTYHPGTAIARQHGMTELDYHSPILSEPPYTFFEEAYEGVSTKLLTVDGIWRIHCETQKRWGSTRNVSQPTLTSSAASEVRRRASPAGRRLTDRAQRQPGPAPDVLVP